jgi:CheY-like chemotaxis protein
LTDGGSGRTILVVDDDSDLREIVREILVNNGFEVATARNGREALAYLNSSHAPAFVLLDLSMPVMDGMAFRSEQQKNPAIADIPVVVFTAAGNSAEKVSSMDVAGYLRKPPELEDLLAIARRFT